MTARKETELASRLAELGITAAELADIVGRSVEEVEGWVKAEAPLGGEAAVLVRFLADAADAQRRVNHLRNAYQGDMRGAGVNYAGISGVPYGSGRQGATGGAPQ
jgi:hypothetical protein